MEKIIDDINNLQIAEATRSTYVSRLKTFFKNGLGSKANIIDVLEKSNPNNHVNSEVSNISNILLFYEKSKNFKKLIDDDDMITELRLMKDNLKLKQKEKQNEERENDVTWDYILDLKNNLNRNNITNTDRLIYMIYTELGFTPRNDFTPMKIVDKPSEVDEDYNYFVRSNGEIILNQYKTRSRYGVIKVKLPQLNTLLDKHQDWLFENKDGDALSENALQKKIGHTFGKLSAGKKITINTLRRSFATYIKSLPLKERTKISHKMGHTSSTNKDYYALDDEAEDRLKELK